MRFLFVAIATLTITTTQAKGIFGELFGGVVGGAVGNMAGKAVASPADIEKSLAKAAAKANEKTPQMVDSSTRMDRVSSGPGRIFTYHHTMISMTKKDVNVDAFNGSFASGLRSRICATEGMRPLFANGVTLVYSYLDSDGLPIGVVNITPQNCGISK